LAAPAANYNIAQVEKSYRKTAFFPGLPAWRPIGPLL